MTGETAEALLAGLLAAPFRRRGRFAVHLGPSGAACAPLGLDPARVTGIAVFARAVPTATWGPRLGARLSVALRQDAWRCLRATRGLVPVGMARPHGAGVEAVVLLCNIDGTAASPRALDTLDIIFDDPLLRRRLRWASRR